MTTDRRTAGAIVFALLVAAAVASRLAGLAPNFAAVSAAALFAGWYFRSRAAALAVPIAAMILSDAIIGFYNGALMLVVYAALAAPVFFRPLLGGRPGPLRIAAGSLAASLLFFLSTNLAVWAGGAYGHTLTGLAACYTAAIPFFKYTLAGDALFAAIFFGAYALAVAASRAPQRAALHPRAA